MAGLFKTLLRVGVVTTACGGLALLIAGPDRASALVGQAHDTIIQHIDATIDDPVALRKQLRELEREYPERIAQVSGDLAELNEQISQLEQEARGLVRPLLRVLVLGGGVAPALAQHVGVHHARTDGDRGEPGG